MHRGIYVLHWGQYNAFRSLRLIASPKSTFEAWYKHYRYIKSNLVLRIVKDDLVCSALSKRGRNKIVVMEVDEIWCDIISTVTMHLGSNVFFKTYHSNTIGYCKNIRMMVYEYENRLLQEYNFWNHLSWPNNRKIIFHCS